MCVPSIEFTAIDNTPAFVIVASPLIATGLKFVPSATNKYALVFVPILRSSPNTSRSPPIVTLPLRLAPVDAISLSLALSVPTIEAPLELIVALLALSAYRWISLAVSKSTLV